MIRIRDCQHSIETTSLAYKRNPEVCTSCKWLEKHPLEPSICGSERHRRAEKAKKQYRANGRFISRHSNGIK